MMLSSTATGARRSAASARAADDKHPFLVALGERVRAARARRGLSRKALAQAAQVSERHLANLECGQGNVSVLVLLQVAGAVQCSLIDLIDDVSASSPAWARLRGLLAPCDEPALERVSEAVAALLGSVPAPVASPRVALIGLRGAGKSTLGRMLADDLGCTFVEISRDIERLAGCSVGEIQALYGMAAYRRFERRALVEVIGAHDAAVIATPGGLVTDAQSYKLLRAHCTTVWLQARPEDHMRRVTEQGDRRPMAASLEAMSDLRGILANRLAYYAQADHKLDTSAQPLPATFDKLRALVRKALQRPALTSPLAPAA